MCHKNKTMRTPVKLRVPYPPDADAGDALQVFTDFGLVRARTLLAPHGVPRGSLSPVDLTRPLLKAGAGLFTVGLQRFEGHGSEIYGESAYGTGLASPPVRSGHGDEVYGTTPYANVPDYREVTVHVPPAFGMHRFAVQLLDEAGNPQGTAPVELEAFVSSEEPPGIKEFAFSSYDPVNDRLTFSLSKNTE